MGRARSRTCRCPRRGCGRGSPPGVRRRAARRGHSADTAAPCRIDCRTSLSSEPRVAYDSDSDIDAVGYQGRKKITVRTAPRTIALFDARLDGGEIILQTGHGCASARDAPERIGAIVTEAVESIVGDLVVQELGDTTFEGRERGGNSFL